MWDRAARLAAWAPDEARELLMDASPEGDVLDVARLAELLGRVFAVTGAWDLATTALADAAASWQDLAPARADALAAIAAALPVAPFASDAEALEAELVLVVRCLTDDEPPVVERALVELRRAQAPRAITGRLEATFGLSPLEVAYVMAAVAPILLDGFPAVPASAWAPRIAASCLTTTASPARLLALGLLQPGPGLPPAPALVSWLLGRTTIAQPTGIQLHRIAPGATPPDADALAVRLLTDRRIGVVVGPPGSGRAAAMAAILAHRGGALFEAHVGALVRHVALTGAALEARLHGGLLALDLDAWGPLDADLLGALAAVAPLVVIASADPAIPEELRAFTLTPL